MTTAIPTRRRSDAERNDQLLWDAGLLLLCERGPDRISALELARSAGLTTGAVYSRYENTAEVLVGLWQHRIAGPLHEFLTTAVEVLTAAPGWERGDEEVIADLIFDHSSPLRAGVSMLIATPRIPELAEYVIPEIQGWLREFGVSDDVHDLASLPILNAISAALGTLYFASASMYSLKDLRRNVLAVQYANQMTGFEQTARRGFADLPPITVQPPFDFTVTSDNPIRDALVNAAAQVIARAGTEHATTQRISRAAKVPPSALFSEYHNRQALFHDVAIRLLEQIYSESRYNAIYGIESGSEPTQPVASNYDDDRLAMYRHSLVTTAANNTVSLLSDVGKTHRRLRLEFQLAAIHHDDIRAVLQQIDQRTIAESGVFHRHVFGFPEDMSRRIARFLRTIAQGAMLLEEVSQMVADRDIRMINARLADFACRRAIGEIQPSTLRSAHSTNVNPQ